MSKLIKIVICVSLICLWAGGARASVVYDITVFSSHPGGLGVSITGGALQLTEPTFITSGIYTTAQMDFGSVTSPAGYSLRQVNFVVPSSVPGYDMIVVGVSNGTGYYYYFTAGDFGAVGNYSSALIGATQYATLAVSNSVAPVPLPATLLLLGPGLAGIAAIRRRFAK